MNRYCRRLVYTLGLIVLLSLIPAISCGTQSSGPVSSSDALHANNSIPKNYADFEVGPLTVTRSGVSSGETATISTTVTNTGGANGTYTAVLTINGQQAGEKNISIGPDKTETVNFQVAENDPGSYQVAIGNSSATLNVYQWPYTIKYDLGDVYGQPLSVAGEYGHIVHFTPPTTPFNIQKMDIYTQAVVAKDSDWYDRFVTVRIWDSSRNQQLWSVDLPWRDFWNDTGSFWKEVDIPNVGVNGDFYVEIVTHSDRFGDEIVAWPWGFEVKPAIFIGYTRSNPYVTSTISLTETRSGISNMAQPIEVQSKYQGLNWLIRITGDGSL